MERTRPTGGPSLPDLCTRYESPDFPETVHVPDLERWAYNQMPKDSGWKELRLVQFVGTDLYQWRGKPKMRDLPGLHYSVFEDQATEVFQIKERS